MDILVQLMEAEDHQRADQPEIENVHQEAELLMNINEDLYLYENTGFVERFTPTTSFPIFKYPTLQSSILMNHTYPNQPITYIKDKTIFMNQASINYLRGYTVPTLTAQIYRINRKHTDRPDTQFYERAGNKITMRTDNQQGYGLFILDTLQTQGFNLPSYQTNTMVSLSSNPPECNLQPAPTPHRLNPTLVQLNRIIFTINLPTEMMQPTCPLHHEAVTINVNYNPEPIQTLNDIKPLYLLNPNHPISQLLGTHPLIQPMIPLIYKTLHTLQDLHNLMDIVLTHLPQHLKDDIIPQISISTNEIFSNQHYCEAAYLYPLETPDGTTLDGYIITPDVLELMMLKRASTARYTTVLHTTT